MDVISLLQLFSSCNEFNLAIMNYWLYGLPYITAQIIKFCFCKGR